VTSGVESNILLLVASPTSRIRNGVASIRPFSFDLGEFHRVIVRLRDETRRPLLVERVEPFGEADFLYCEKVISVHL
jgi:hypothetical protein